MAAVLELAVDADHRDSDGAEGRPASGGELSVSSLSTVESDLRERERHVADDLVRRVIAVGEKPGRRSARGGGVSERTAAEELADLHLAGVLGAVASGHAVERVDGSLQCIVYGRLEPSDDRGQRVLREQRSGRLRAHRRFG